MSVNCPSAILLVGNRLPNPILVARHKFALPADLSRSLIPGGIWGCGRFPDVGHPWPIHGLDAVSTSSGDRTGHVCGRELDKATDSWPDFVGRVPATSDHALEIAWTICRMLHVCQADCDADLSRNGPDVSWLLRDHFPVSREIFPGNLLGRCAAVARTLRRTYAPCCANRCADIFRLLREMLPGECSDYSWTIARLLRRIPRGMLHGHCVNWCLTFM